MANAVPSFGSIEQAVEALLLQSYQPLIDLGTDSDRAVGGDLAFDPSTQDWYIRIDKVGGRSDRLEGDFVVDIEVFGAGSIGYVNTESHALDIEALLLGYPHVVEVGDRKVVFDTVSQNTLPDELPWEDDEVTRLGATYVITTRRR
jgi:hypothetical protein